MRSKRGEGDNGEHFNFARGSYSRVGSGRVLAKVSRSGAGIATAISFVPFRSGIAYNVEIKRPAEPPSRHVSQPFSSRVTITTGGRERERGRMERPGIWKSTNHLWHRNSISPPRVSFAILNDTTSLVTPIPSASKSLDEHEISMNLALLIVALG